MTSELSRDFQVSISDCDARGRIRPSAILVSMQELAEVHSSSLGLSRKMLVENGMVWVLYRQSATMHRYPSFSEDVRLTTWPGAIDGPIFPRYFALTLEDGTPLGEMVTSWILIDIGTRRPLRPSALPGTVPPADRPAPLPMPGMLRVGDAPLAEVRTVRYSDLDVNGHMNNTRYLDWICDLADVDTLLEKGLHTWQINYISEAKAGENLQLSTKEQDGMTLILGKAEDSSRTIFEASISFGV